VRKLKGGMSGLSVIALVGALMLDGFFLFAAIFRVRHFELYKQ